MPSPFVTPNTLCSWIPLFSLNKHLGTQIGWKLWCSISNTINRLQMTQREHSTHWRIENTFLTPSRRKKKPPVCYVCLQQALPDRVLCSNLPIPLLWISPSNPWDPCHIHVFSANLLVDGVSLTILDVSLLLFSALSREGAVIFQGCVVLVEVILLIFQTPPTLSYLFYTHVAL